MIHPNALRILAAAGRDEMVNRHIDASERWTDRGKLATHAMLASALAQVVVVFLVEGDVAVRFVPITYVAILVALQFNHFCLQRSGEHLRYVTYMTGWHTGMAHIQPTPDPYCDVKP